MRLCLFATKAWPSVSKVTGRIKPHINFIFNSDNVSKNVRKIAGKLKYFKGHTKIHRMSKYTNAHEDDCMKFPSPFEVPIFTSFSSAVFLLITVPGNLLAILTIIKDPLKQLRTSFNFFVVSLAAADLMVGSIVEPISILVHTKEALQKPINLLLIKALHLTSVTSASASVCNLSALTIERFMALKYQFIHRVYFTTRNNAVAAAILWIFSITSTTICYLCLGPILTILVFINCYVFITVIVMISTTLLLWSVMKNRERSHNKGLNRYPCCSFEEIPDNYKEMDGSDKKTLGNCIHASEWQ